MALLTQQGYSIPKIAEMYGISRQAVSQLLQKAARDGNKVVLRRCGVNHNKNQNYEYRPTIKEKGYAKVCVICNKAFKSKLKTTRTCSKKCRRILLHKSIIDSKGTAGNWSRYENVELTCDNCGKIFERSKYRDSISKLGCGTKHTYCSRDCYHEKCRKIPGLVEAYKSNFWPTLDQYQKRLDGKNS